MLSPCVSKNVLTSFSNSPQYSRCSSSVRAPPGSTGIGGDRAARSVAALLTAVATETRADSEPQTSGASAFAHVPRASVTTLCPPGTVCFVDVADDPIEFDAHADWVPSVLSPRLSLPTENENSAGATNGVGADEDVMGLHLSSISVEVRFIGIDSVPPRLLGKKCLQFLLWKSLSASKP